LDTLITICARGGSKGLPNKAIKNFCGKPLIQWTVNTALRYSMNHRCMITVSTDSMKIIDFVLGYRGIYIIDRPPTLAQDHTPKLDAIRHCLHECEKAFTCQFETVIDLDITNPIRTAKDIENCMAIFQSGKAKTVYSVTKARKNPYFNQVQSGGKVCFGIYTDRQSCPEVYDLNSNIYVYDRVWLADDQNLSPITNESRMYVMPEYTFCDIDTEVDFFVAEKLMEKYNEIRPVGTT
jgi:CMP-N,N'-diacetyllegionaminic acid synthase